MRRWTLSVVFLACVVPRCAALLVWPHPDDTMYSGLSTELVHAHRYTLDGVASTEIEPFYPAALAAARLVTGDRPRLLVGLQIALAGGGGVLLFLLAEGLTSGRRVAWAATLAYALSPYLIRQSVAFMEVTLAIVLLIAAARRLRTVRTFGQAAAAGLLLGALVLTRFSFLPIAAGGLAIVAWREGMTRGLVALAVVAASVAPWMAYSYRVDGSILPSRVGENLFVSTNQWSAVVVPRLNVDLIVDVSTDLARDDLTRRGVAAPGQGQVDGALLRLAIAYARAHPVDVAWLKLRNLAYTLQPRLLPFFERRGTATIVNGQLEIPEQARRPVAFELVAGLFQLLLLVGGAAGLVMRRHQIREDAFLWVILVGVIAVNTIFFPTSRLLAPMAFVWMFYTAVAADRLLANPRTFFTSSSAAARHRR